MNSVFVLVLLAQVAPPAPHESASVRTSGLTCLSPSATCLFSSNTADATTSSTVAAITLQSTVNITDTDLVLEVNKSDGTQILGLTEAGILTTSKLGLGTSPAGGAHLLSEANGSTPTEFGSNDFVVGRSAATGASSGALFFRYNSSSNIGVVGALSPSVSWRELRLIGSNFAMQNASAQDVMTVSSGGRGVLREGLTINSAGGGSKPSCDSSVRGMAWYVQGGAGVADTYEVCTKDAADAYAWRSVY